MQLAQDGSPEAVDRYGAALMLSLAPLADDLAPETVHAGLTADRGARRELLERLVGLRGATDDDDAA